MASRKRLARIAVAMVVALVALPLGAEPPTEKVPSPNGGTQGGGLDGTGVVQYDPPGSADEFIGNYGQWIGNVFDTRAGNPLETGNVTQLAGLWGGTDATFPFLGVFNSAGTSALFSGAFAGLVPFTFNTIAVTGVNNVAPGFLAGVFVSSAFSTSADSVGAQSQSTLGQGFHAAAFGAGVSPIANRNAMVRIAGSVWVVPVELMDFVIQ